MSTQVMMDLGHWPSHQLELWANAIDEELAFRARSSHGPSADVIEAARSQNVYNPGCPNKIAAIRKIREEMRNSLREAIDLYEGWRKDGLL